MTSKELPLSDKALLLAHLLLEEGRVSDSLVIYEILIELGEISAKTRVADILSQPPEYIDVEKAKQLYREACLSGDATACYNLGVLLEQLGDSVSAQRFYELAYSRDPTLRDEDYDDKGLR